MKIIEPSVELVNAPSYPNILSLIEQAGRTCYKSESKITEDSAEKFVIDAMVLYTLMVHLGFGPKRLRRFYEAFQ